MVRILSVSKQIFPCPCNLRLMPRLRYLQRAAHVGHELSLVRAEVRLKSQSPNLLATNLFGHRRDVRSSCDTALAGAFIWMG